MPSFHYTAEGTEQETSSTSDATTNSASSAGSHAGSMPAGPDRSHFWRRTAAEYRKLDLSRELSPAVLNLLQRRLAGREAQIDPIRLAQTLYLLLGAITDETIRLSRLTCVSADALEKRSRYTNTSRTLHHFTYNAISIGMLNAGWRRATSLATGWVNSLDSEGLTGLARGMLTGLASGGLIGLQLWMALQHTPNLARRTAAVLQMLIPLAYTSGLFPAAAEQAMITLLSDYLPELVFSAYEMYQNVVTITAPWLPASWLLLIFYAAVYVHILHGRSLPLPEGWGRLLASLPSWADFITRHASWLARAAGFNQPEATILDAVVAEGSSAEMQARGIRTFSHNDTSEYREYQLSNNTLTFNYTMLNDSLASALNRQSALMLTKPRPVQGSITRSTSAENDPTIPFVTADALANLLPLSALAEHTFAGLRASGQSFHGVQIDIVSLVDVYLARYHLFSSQSPRPEVWHAILSEEEERYLWQLVANPEPSKEDLMPPPMPSTSDKSVPSPLQMLLQESLTREPVSSVAADGRGQYRLLVAVSCLTTSGMRTGVLTGLQVLAGSALLGGISWLALNRQAMDSEVPQSDTIARRRELNYSIDSSGSTQAGPEKDALSELEVMLVRFLLRPLQGISGENLLGYIEDKLAAPDNYLHRRPVKREVSEHAEDENVTANADSAEIRLRNILQQPLPVSLQQDLHSPNIQQALEHTLDINHMDVNQDAYLNAVMHLVSRRFKRNTERPVDYELLYRVHTRADLKTSYLLIQNIRPWRPVGRFANADFDLPANHHIILSYVDKIAGNKELRIDIPENRRQQGVWHQQAAQVIIDKGRPYLTAGQVYPVGPSFMRGALSPPANSDHRNVIYAAPSVSNVKWQIKASNTDEAARRWAVYEMIKTRRMKEKFPELTKENQHGIDFDRTYFLIRADRPRNLIISDFHIYTPAGYKALDIINESQTNLPENSHFVLDIYRSDNTLRNRVSIAVPQNKCRNTIWQKYVADKINMLAESELVKETLLLKAGNGVIERSGNATTIVYGEPIESSYRNVIYTAGNADISRIVWYIDNHASVTLNKTEPESEQNYLSHINKFIQEIQFYIERAGVEQMDFSVDFEGKIHGKHGPIYVAGTPWMRQDLRNNSLPYLTEMKRCYQKIEAAVKSAGEDAEAIYNTAELFITQIKTCIEKGDIAGIEDKKRFIDNYFVTEFGEKPGLMDKKVTYKCTETAWETINPASQHIRSTRPYTASISVYDYITNEEERNKFDKGYQGRFHFPLTDRNSFTHITRKTDSIIFPEDIKAATRTELGSILTSGKIRDLYEAFANEVFKKPEYEFIKKTLFDITISAQLINIATAHFTLFLIQPDGTLPPTSVKVLTSQEMSWYTEAANRAHATGEGLVTLQHNSDHANGIILLKAKNPNEYVVIPLAGDKFTLISISESGTVNDNTIAFLSQFFPEGTLENASLVKMYSGKNAGPVFVEKFKLNHFSPRGPLLESLWTGYKENNLAKIRSLFKTWLEAKEDQAAKLTERFVVPAISMASLILTIPVSGLAALPEELIMMELMEGVTVHVSDDTLELTLKVANMGLLVDEPLVYMLEAAANTDRPLAARRNWDNFVMAIYINMLLMSPGFMPEMSVEARTAAADQAYRSLIREMKDKGSRRRILTAFSQADEMLDVSLENSVAAYRLTSLAELSATLPGTLVMITRADEDKVFQVLVKESQGKFWRKQSDKLHEVISESEHGFLQDENGLKLNGLAVDIYEYDADQMTQKPKTIIEAFYSDEKLDIFCPNRVRRIPGELTACWQIGLPQKSRNPETIKNKVSRYKNKIQDLILVENKSEIQRRAASDFQQGRLESEQFDPDWLHSGTIGLLLDAFNNQQEPVTHIALSFRELGAISIKIDNALEKINIQMAEVWLKKARIRNKADKQLGWIAPQNYYLGDGPGECLPASIFMAKAIESDNINNFVNQLLGLKDETVPKTAKLMRQLKELHGSSSSEAALNIKRMINSRPASLRMIFNSKNPVINPSITESTIFPDNLSSSLLEIPGHAMSVTRALSYQDKINFYFYDPNFGIVVFDNFYYLMKFIHAHLANIKSYRYSGVITCRPLNFNAVQNQRLQGQTLDEIVNQ